MKITFFLKQAGKTALIIFCLMAFDIGCPLRYILHIPCPACGITRAWQSALHLDFSSAFYYHPLFLCVPFVLLYAAFYDQKDMTRYDVYIKILALLFLIVYLLRFPEIP